jgi:hypothetical protein
MVEYKKGRLIYLALSEFFEIQSPQVNIFAVDNIYHKYPSFYFYFSEQNTELYDFLMRIVEEYRSGSMWKMYKANMGKGYVIVPKEIFDKKNDSIEHEHIKRSVDNALSDVEEFRITTK